MPGEMSDSKRESLRGTIKRTLLGPQYHDNWGKQEGLERALMAIESIQTAAQHFHPQEQGNENEEAVFTAEFTALRAQFELVKMAQKESSHRHEVNRNEARYEHKMTEIREESIHDSTISVETMDDKWRHTGERVSPEYIVISDEPDPILYDVPEEFLEVLDRMMVSAVGL